MPAALIVGAFGQDNPGDEALLAAAVSAVRAQDGWDPIVVTARPEEARALLAVEAVPASATSAAAAAARADALVVGGGTVFKELHPRSGRAPGSLLRRSLAMSGVFHARRRPVALIGVGAAPITAPSNRRLAVNLVRHADLLVLRDDESAELLGGLGAPTPLRVGADLSWLSVTQPGVEQPAPATAPIGVAVSHLAMGDDEVARVAEGLRAVAATRPIEIEPWQGSPRLGADGLLASRLAAAVGPGATVVAPPADMDEATQRMARRSVAFAMRFHATVAAALAGTRFVAFAHEPKLAAMARSLGQVAVTPDAPSAVIASALRQGLAGAAPSPDAITSHRERAAATADLLRLVLAGEGPADRLGALDLVPAPTPIGAPG